MSSSVAKWTAERGVPIGGRTMLIQKRAGENLPSPSLRYFLIGAIRTFWLFKIAGHRRPMVNRTEFVANRNG